MMAQSDGQQRELRIGDADRTAAAEELAEHYAQGRISPEEHSDRLDRIWAAKTRAEQLYTPQRALADPHRALTPRAREHFHLNIDGLTTKELARKLEITAQTPENHRSRVLDKLDVRNTAELVRYAVHHGLLD